MNLYYHKTSGGAEYLTDAFILTPTGHKEGSIRDAKFFVRIDGDITKDAEISFKQPNLYLSVIQYDAIMECINHGKALIADDDFIDPYGEIPDGYNNETLLQALNEVEQKIITDNIPT